MIGENIQCPGEKHSNVKELWRRYSVIQSNPTIDNFNAFELLLRQTVTTYLQSPNTKIRTELAQLWIHKTKLALAMHVKPALSRASANRFIGLTDLPGVVEDLVMETDNHQVLACASLYTACPGIPIGRYSNDSGYGIVEKWLGAPLPTGISNSLSGLTDFMYGPGVWDLYRPDVAIDTELAQHLYLQGVPLLGELFTKNTNNKISEADVFTELPHDML